MTPSIEKVLAFDAAEELLARNDVKSLRYLALEVRRCLEAVIYEKLNSYAGSLPPYAVQKWQPDQAFKALLQMIPDADMDMTICVALNAPDEEPNIDQLKTLGIDYRPDWKWLRKEYQKLGSLLHAAWPFEKEPKHIDPARQREYLQRLLKQLEPYVRGMTCSMWNVVHFNCLECGEDIAVHENAKEALCIACECLHRVGREKGNLFLIPVNPVFRCQCNWEFIVPNRAKPDYEFSCQGCNRRFKLVWRVPPRE